MRFAHDGAAHPAFFDEVRGFDPPPPDREDFALDERDPEDFDPALFDAELFEPDPLRDRPDPDLDPPAFSSWTDFFSASIRSMT